MTNDCENAAPYRLNRNISPQICDPPKAIFKLDHVLYILRRLAGLKANNISFDLFSSFVKAQIITFPMKVRRYMFILPSFMTKFGEGSMVLMCKVGQLIILVLPLYKTAQCNHHKFSNRVSYHFIRSFVLFFGYVFKKSTACR